MSAFSTNAGKYGPEKTPYLDTSHAMIIERKELNCILRLRLHFRREFQVLIKVSFEPNSVAVSWSLLNRETRLDCI